MTAVGRVAGVWRYPVKSLDGEQMPALALDRRGVERDRLWALVDGNGAIASGKRTRRFRRVPGLLRHSSHLDGEIPVITLSDGRAARADHEEAAELLREMPVPGGRFGASRRSRTSMPAPCTS